MVISEELYKAGKMLMHVHTRCEIDNIENRMHLDLTKSEVTDSLLGQKI